MKDEMELIHRLIDVFKYKENYQGETSKLQSQDMYVLERIYLRGRTSAGDIAKNYGMPPSTLTGIMDRLHQKGYIERVRSKEDRRMIEIIVSKRGKDIIDQHIHEDKYFVRNFFNTLETEKKEQLKDLLTELIEGIEKEKLFEE